MKKLTTLMLLLVAFAVQAQTFEGTVRWSMSLVITDPEMKAKMAEAQRQLNDPATQAQFKEMQAKMNDPEMKKMMEQNPQIKAAMESAMKSATTGGAPSMDNMMPKGMVVKIKGANMSTLMEGGMADGMEMLHQGGHVPVRINRAEKTYSTMPEGPTGATPDVTVNKMGETITILGYTCNKYVVEMLQNGKPMKQIVWATSDIKDMDVKALSRQRMGQGQTMFSNKIEGVPMKIEAASPQGTMVMEVTEIKREKLNDADFTIPSGFKETKMKGY